MSKQSPVAFMEQLAAPARRALISKGITTVESLSFYSEKEILEKNAITGWRFNGNIKRASAVRPAAIGSHPAPYKPMAVTATPYIKTSVNPLLPVRYR